MVALIIMLILSIDTSTRGCSVALHENGVLLAGNDLFTDKSSSAMLTTLIQNVVENSGFKLSDVDAVAVAKGPGSYTGLRVSVSTAKGLCYALDKPLIAINTLQAMALQVIPHFAENVFFCPMIDARRMEVYTAIHDSSGKVIRPTEAIIMNEESFKDILLTDKVVFFGDGAAKCKALLSASPNAIFINAEIRPSAKTVGNLATKEFAVGNFEDIASFEPYYLKDFMSPPSRKSVSAT
jgi:tRNA threonylcarbamoyladenosine biosynthesis protein TsaB